MKANIWRSLKRLTQKGHFIKFKNSVGEIVYSRNNKNPYRAKRQGSEVWSLPRFMNRPMTQDFLSDWIHVILEIEQICLTEKEIVDKIFDTKTKASLIHHNA